MSEVTVRIKMLEGSEDLVPKKAHHDDAAFDLRSRVDIDLPHGETLMVPTGLHLELPHGYEAQVRPRSGLSLKHSLLIVNTPGTIDAGYRGEVAVIIHNLKKETFTIKRGDRIAQMVIQKLPEVQFEVVTELSETLRGEGGFGSTGKK